MTRRDLSREDREGRKVFVDRINMINRIEKGAEA